MRKHSSISIVDYFIITDSSPSLGHLQEQHGTMIGRRCGIQAMLNSLYRCTVVDGKSCKILQKERFTYDWVNLSIQIW